MQSDWLSHVTTAPDATRSERDEKFVAYLAAYEDYTTLHVELESQLRQGHLAISRSRRDLSRNNAGAPTLSSTLYPREMSATVVVVSNPLDSDTDSTAVLTWKERTGEDDVELADAFGLDSDDYEAVPEAPEPSAAACTEDAEGAEGAALAELQRWGISSSLQREIASAVTDNGDDVAMACGDVVAIEHRAGGAVVGSSAQNFRSEMSFGASGLGDLKRAQFQAALQSGADDYEGEDGIRPSPQSRPSSGRDPMRWFTLLPPPSMRQAQKCFRRATETAVLCANAQARMIAARAAYNALLGDDLACIAASHSTETQTKTPG
jgi:hypothetical protein